jgi:transposase, IS30 family
MKKSYRHLSEEERETLWLLINRGRSLRIIGRFMGRAGSTLSREIKRNSTGVEYRVFTAHRRALERFSHHHRRPRLKNEELKKVVRKLLEQKWSPETIAGTLKRNGGGQRISPEAIYQWIYQEAPELSVNLAGARRRRRKRVRVKWSRVRIPGRVPVGQRPEPVQGRQEAGHWESDLMVGPGETALQVVVERKTRYTKLCRIPNKSAQASYQGLRALLAPVPEGLRKTITYDNGAENVLHQELNLSLGTKSYFCEPYHSWEKGTVENTNGLIRRFLPKKTDFDKIPEKYLEAIAFWLNNRPRKCLGYQTPADAFSVHTVALAP